jgi:ABC-type transport system substrate-binding protein
MNQAETAGMGKVTGNWINDDVQYAIEWPEFQRNVEKAKHLLREAGYPNGFDVDWVTPIPAFYSRGERIIAQLREVGIRARLQTMERGIFFQRLQGGLKEFPGTQIILHGVRIAGSWSFWYEGYFKCGGFSSRDRICVKDLDVKFDQYERSINPAERRSSPRRSSAASWKTTISCPCSATRSSTRSAPGSPRRSGRTSSRPSRPAMPIPGRT